MSQLNNKIAIITGASDTRGIGFACAQALANKGATVIITDLSSRQKELQEAEKLLVQGGATAFSRELDVTDPAQAQAVMEWCAEQAGGIDILINNAGVGHGAKPFMETTCDEWRISWEVNVLGMVNCAQAAIPHLRKRGGGVIVNNASVQGLRALPAYGAYTTHKHAVIGLTRTLAGEFGREGIRVLALCPGVIDTTMNDAQVLKQARDHDVDPQLIRKNMGKNMALRRIGNPEEVGKAAAFMVSDDASYLTGNAIEVSGGLLYGL